MDGWLAREDGRMKAGFKKQEAEKLMEEQGIGVRGEARRENDWIGRGART
jgi:hypothetical protein